jgi:hypothetical protein
LHLALGTESLAFNRIARHHLIHFIDAEPRPSTMSPTGCLARSGREVNEDRLPSIVYSWGP